MHQSRVLHFIAKNEFECMDEIKKLLSYIPQNNTEEPPLVEGIDDPNRIEPNLINILPENPYQQYDMKKIIKLLWTQENF